MHFAKGLEFKAVAVMACDDEALPLQSRVDDATDEDELREVSRPSGTCSTSPARAPAIICTSAA
ncbi:hypothetical protein [Novosphingobium sp. Gsoil 351]|uniref:hypothetical protein n=1 Tax=Novosphingobium sp. Gsoil 351 TaxID=2675225 RepID=UPI00351B2A96